MISFDFFQAWQYFFWNEFYSRDTIISLKISVHYVMSPSWPRFPFALFENLRNNKFMVSLSKYPCPCKSRVYICTYMKIKYINYIYTDLLKPQLLLLKYFSCGGMNFINTIFWRWEIIDKKHLNIPWNCISHRTCSVSVTITVSQTRRAYIHDRVWKHCGVLKFFFILSARVIFYSQIP